MVHSLTVVRYGTYLPGSYPGSVKGYGTGSVA